MSRHHAHAGLLIATLTLSLLAPVAAERAVDSGVAARVGDHAITLAEVDQVAMVQDSGGSGGCACAMPSTRRARTPSRPSLPIT